MAQGFITNAAAVTVITNVWSAAKGIKLEATSTGDDLSRHPMPQACHKSHVTVKADETVAACTKLTAMLTWDAAGDDVMAGPTAEGDVWDGLTDVSLRMISFRLDAWITATSEQANAGECYLWLKTDAGTITVPIGGAKLHWFVPPP